ncbi:4-hydroxy-tetrahydrodipicolinate synthase [Streptomyces olivaceus]|uniref:4-hydroxy-tetrahydrodipicolinate synthase n=1 Tax=Streptomyces olivaceus TaxID=47716 RepID=UPI0040561F00
MRFRSDPSALRGSLAAVLTPFTDDGELDVAGLTELARWQRDAGADGLSIGGSTGEPSSQSAEERVTAMRAVAEVAGDQVPFVPATGSTKLEETLALTAAARDLGADAALVITPYYAKPTQEGLVEWYTTVAGEFPDLPIVVYNVPTRTAVDLAPETALELRRRCDNIVGIKETTKDFEHFSRVLHRCGRDFLVWSGIELLALPLLALGGAGFISALSNLAPRSLADMYRHWHNGELEEAARVHYRLHPLVDLLFVETNPAPAKWALQHAGRLASAKVRPPLVSPGPAAQQRILGLLDEAKDVVEYERLAATVGTH